MIKKILPFIVPVVMTLVATYNLVQVNNTELTRWRGGGFGMYTEPHWKDNEVWFIGIPYEIDVMTVYSGEIDKVRRQPNDSNIKELGKILQKKHAYENFSIQVWTIDYDIETFKATKVLANELFFQ